MVKIKYDGGGRNKRRSLQRRRLVASHPLFFVVIGLVLVILVVALVATRSISSQGENHDVADTYQTMDSSSNRQQQRDATFLLRNGGSQPKQPSLPSATQQNESPRYFVVFSTGCTPFQNWQGLAFFYFCRNVKQRGTITRIASGCSDSQAEQEREIFNQKIRPLSPDYHLHITPDYGVEHHDNTKYWNKPKGLLDYLENILGFPDKSEEYQDDIIIILDPDMMLLHPISHIFENFEDEFWMGEHPKTTTVQHGMPIAQAYGYGSEWLTSLNGNLSYVVGLNSPALDVTLEQAKLYYPAGPPYLATGRDMYALARCWNLFLPQVHKLFPNFMAEMHAYSIAAAHLQLPHQLAKGFMVSDVGAEHPQAFGFLNTVSRQDACEIAVHPPQQAQQHDERPFVLHYCQRYAVGRWFFSKYKLPNNFFDCDAPLMMEPPLDVGQTYDWHVFPNGIEAKDYSNPEKHHFIVQNAWMLCSMIYNLNSVATEIKQHHCSGKANFAKTWHFQKQHLFQAMLDDASNPFQNPDKAKVHGIDLRKVNKDELY